MPIVRRTRADLDLSKVDWARLARTSDREIAAQIAADADTAPVFSAAELARARRVVPPPLPRNVKALRDRLGLSQQQFADRYGFSVETIRNYEQGHRRPAGPARVLLEIIASEPDAVTRALARKSRRATARTHAK
jgi:putative transcriptional regulator